MLSVRVMVDGGFTRNKWIFVTLALVGLRLAIASLTPCDREHIQSRSAVVLCIFLPASLVLTCAIEVGSI